MMPMSYDSLVRSMTWDYIATIRAGKTVHAEPEEYADELLAETVAMITAYNATHIGPKIKIPAKLENSQVAELVVALEPAARIACAGPNADANYDLIGVYQNGGPDKGLYSVDEREIRRLIRRYKYTANMRDVQDIMGQLQTMLPRKNRTQDRNLIAVNNGVFDYTNKTLLPFSPDMVFLAKSRVDYKPSARNVVIHNPDDGTDWDVESWMSELSDDPEVVDLLWQILGAIVRPFVRWRKSAWFYSYSGNSGKGTLCELMRNLCGSGSYASISLNAFGQGDFQLEPLIKASAIIVDENDVGTYIDKAANLKAVITNDVIQINRKFKSAIAYQFFGFMVQCLNEFPRIKDTSDSFYRRQLFIPFDRCFTGAERKYIKDDYLARPEVLEYVLFKVLNMDYYELSEPESCKKAMAEYKEYNDPLQMFMQDVLPLTAWSLLPYTFLYDLYKAWFRENSPSGKAIGRNTFVQDIYNMATMGRFPGWGCTPRKKPVRVKGLMDAPEPLILRYQLDAWKNPNYTGHDPSRICSPTPKPMYEGLIRLVPASGGAPSGVANNPAC